MGIAGTVPREYLSLLVDEGLAFTPDLVIVCVFIGNDFMPLKTALYERSYVASAIHFLFVARQVPDLIVHGRTVYRDDGATLSSETYLGLVAARRRIYLDQGQRFRRGLPDALAHLARMQEICRRRSASLLVVVIPDEVQVNVELQQDVTSRLGRRPADLDFGAPNAILAEELRSRGLRF